MAFQKYQCQNCGTLVTILRTMTVTVHVWAHNWSVNSHNKQINHPPTPDCPVCAALAQQSPDLLLDLSRGEVTSEAARSLARSLGLPTLSTTGGRASRSQQ